MKELQLGCIHKKLGAKMVPFAGFNMPVQYEGVNIEHKAVRSAVGVFDVSHMGEFILEGPNAEKLVQKVSSNDVSKLRPGQAQYSCLPNETGGIIDDLIVYKMEDTRFLLVVNAANIQKDWNWISNQNDLGVTMKNVSEEYALLAIQGPKTIQAIQSLTPINLNNIPLYSFKIGEFAGCSDVIISATGYTGSGGFEIYCKNDEVEQIWSQVFKAGAIYDIKPIGLAARDTLRLEMGYCLYGNDLNDNTSPIEAGLSWITKFDKEFTNSKALKIQKEKGVTKKLVGFELIDKGIPRKDYDITDRKGQNIGIVSSGTMGPSVNKGIGMGYVSVENTKIGSEIYIRVRKRLLKAIVVKLPFYKIDA